MPRVFHSAQSRGFAHHDWLVTHHSFSFASYYDPERMGFGALRVLNDDTLVPGSGFGRHPHENMEIITIPLSGALKHEDSLGNSAVIETGEVQVMSAGTGVEHAEYNASPTDPLTLLQIWITTEKKNVKPRYDQKAFDRTLFQDAFVEVVGSMGQAPLWIYQDARVSLGRFTAGETVSYTPKGAEYGVYFFIIEGEASIAGDQLKQRDALGIWEMSSIPIRAEVALFLLALEVPLRGG